MIEKAKIKIPKINTELLKKNFLAVSAVALILVLGLNILVWKVGQSAANQARILIEKKEQIKSAKERIAKFTKAKPYLKTEEFARKVPFWAVPPVAAIQQAGIIISEVGAQGPVTVTENDTGDSGSKGSSGSDDKSVVMVGSKTLKEVTFSFKFESNYGDFMKILERLSVAEPLIVVKGFTIKRIDNNDQQGEPIEGTPFFTIPKVNADLRRLTVELKLSSFSEISPDEGIWTLSQ